MRLIGPLRRSLWLAAAIGEGVLEVALTVVREARAALEEVVPEAPTREAPEAQPQPTFRRRPTPRSRPASRPPRPAPTHAAPPVSDKVKTLDDKPVPVAEFGEAGADEDAGADVHVDEPWEGYAGMTAAQVKARLGKANRELVAAVVLYEGFGKRRSSVIDTAERRLTRLNAPRS